MNLREEIEKEKIRIREEERLLRQSQAHINSEEYKLKTSFHKFCTGEKIKSHEKELILDELQRIIDNESLDDTILADDINVYLDSGSMLPIELQIAFEEIKYFIKRKNIESYTGKHTSYNIEYYNEERFLKLERSLKKYNLTAFKELVFEVYPNIKKGIFKGNIINKNNSVVIMKTSLPTDEMFSKIHGVIKLVYEIFENEQTIVLKTILPEDILLEGHKTELATYKGVTISKQHESKEKFKVDLLNMLNKKGK